MHTFYVWVAPAGIEPTTLGVAKNTLYRLSHTGPLPGLLPELFWRKFSRKWVCVYTGSPALTFRQPIMSMQSYTEPSVLLPHFRGAWRCSTELNLASGGSTIASHHPYCASDHIFGLSIHLFSCNNGDFQQTQLLHLLIYSSLIDVQAKIKF